MDTERVRLGWFRWCGLAVVAVAAAALSFESLRQLAIACGTPVELAWLLPIAVDAGAVVALSLWMSRSVPDRARRFACAVSLSAIALSVAGNATQHALTAYEVAPPWWAVVAIGAAPAAMLAAVAELVALVVANQASTQPAAPAEQPERPAVPLATVTIQPAAPVEDHQPTTNHQPPTTEPDPVVVEDDQPATSNQETDQPGDLLERARRLVADADGPVGRTVLKRELGITDHRARKLKRQLDQEARPALHAVASG